MADWTPLTVVSRSLTTAEIDTFINEVSMTNTNIAIARRIPSRETLVSVSNIGGGVSRMSQTMPNSPDRARQQLHRVRSTGAGVEGAARVP